MGKGGVEFKKRLLRGDILVGTHVSLTDFTLTEMCGNFGFDYVWIDTEHSAIDYQELNMHILAAQAKGLAALVRIPFAEPFLAKRVLEMGPDGIIFPMIRSAQMAAEAMNACLYPPLGTRGFGAARAWNYGTMGLETYLNTVNESLCRFIQIELKDAVDNIDTILQVPYIDGYVIGPMDLSGSLGHLGESYGETTTKMISFILDKVKQTGRPVGTSVGDMTEEKLRHWFDLGMRFVSAGGDTAFINQGCASLIDTFNKIKATL